MKVVLSNVLWFESENHLADFNKKTDVLHTKNWNDWYDYAQRSISALNRFGIKAIKVTVTPEQFLAWCKNNNVEPDRNTLKAFIENQ